MGELLDQAHVFPQSNLNRRHREEPRVELSKLLTGVTHNVIEVHARQAAVALGNMNLEVPRANGPEDPAAVVEHHVPPAVPFAQQEQRRLIDAVCNAIIGDLVKRPTQAGGRREQIGDMKDAQRTRSACMAETAVAQTRILRDQDS